MIIEFLDKFEDWKDGLAPREEVGRTYSWKAQPYRDIRFDAVKNISSGEVFTCMVVKAVLVYPKTPEHLVVYIVDKWIGQYVKYVENEVQDAKKKLDEWYESVKTKIKELLGELPIEGCYNPGDIARQIWRN